MWLTLFHPRVYLMHKVGEKIKRVSINLWNSGLSMSKTIKGTLNVVWCLASITCDEMFLCAIDERSSIRSLVVADVEGVHFQAPEAFYL
jgi:hypothetical protein